MVKSIDDLQEGFYLSIEPIRSPNIKLRFVCKEGEKWVSYAPGGEVALNQFRKEIGSNTLELDPLYLEGPIDPFEYLNKHTFNLRKFIDSKLEQPTKHPSRQRMSKVVREFGL